MSSTPANSETSKKPSVKPAKKRFEQAQVMLVNSIKFIKDHCMYQRSTFSNFNNM